MLDTDRMTAADIEWARQNVPGCQFVQVKATTERPKDKPAKPSKIKGAMNGLESAFDRACTVPHFYEQVTFWLAGDCRYTPDFLLVLPSGQVVFVETKGPYEREDSRIKLKVAAERYGHWLWYLVKRGSQGQWKAFPVNANGISRKPVKVGWLEGRA